MPRRVVGSLMVLSGTISCGKAPQLVKSTPSVIIGNDNRRSIDDHPYADKLKGVRGAIGLLDKQCTVFHLGGGLVATAGHCLPRLQVTTNHRSCPEHTIQWEKDSDGIQTRSQCIEIVEHQHNAASDFAFMIVDPPPRSSLMVDRKSFPHDQDTGKGGQEHDDQHQDSDHIHFRSQENVIVVGYAAGSDLQADDVCTANEGTTLGEDIVHNCDTLPGNSGSPILNAETLEVMGIHNGGYDQKNYGTLLMRTSVLKHMETALNDFRTFHVKLSDSKFGPFEHNQKNILLSFLQEESTRVSFELSIDVDDGYDMVRVSSAGQRMMEYTGKQILSLRDLSTPVVIDFVSDYEGTSQEIKISKVSTEN